MRLDKVYLKNFKCFEEETLELGKVTLLTGCNSTGKSSIIQSILLLKQNIASLKRYQNIEGSTSFESINKVNLKGEYVDLGIGADLLYEDANDDNVVVKLFTKDKKYNFNMDVTGNTDNDLLPCKVEVLNINDDALDEDINVFMGSSFQYLHAERIGSKRLYEHSPSMVAEGKLGVSGEYAPHYLAENKDKKLNIEALKHPNSIANTLLANVSKWLGEISKGIDVKSEAIHDIRGVKLTYSYAGSKSYYPQDVGFGITYTLPIIVAILKSKPGDIIVIENPESHLHPSGQVAMAKLFSIAGNNGVQVIVETHSDHILNGLRVAIKEDKIDANEVSIYYQEKDEDTMKINPIKIVVDSNGKVHKWPKGFFDEWDNQLEKLLW